MVLAKTASETACSCDILYLVVTELRTTTLFPDIQVYNNSGHFGTWEELAIYSHSTRHPSFQGWASEHEWHLGNISLQLNFMD